MSVINDGLQILSDSEKRAHYDSYLLLSQRKIVQKHSRQGSTPYMYTSHTTMNKQMEIVEWLKWYRFAINDIVSQRKAVVGTGYFDVLEADFYSAIHAAYYGPVIEPMDLLPDRFEAEERSVHENPEVLHLVSLRNLFGMVCLVDRVPKLSFTYNEKLTSSTSAASIMSQSTQNARICMNDEKENHGGISQIQVTDKNHVSYAYRDLELHVSGRGVAVATRSPPKSCFGEMQNEDVEDHIQVFLTLDDDFMLFGKGLDRKLNVIILIEVSRVRDKKGRTVQSQRYWDGFDANEQFDERLHPAMYLLALAYRTLDIEDAKIRKQTIWDIAEEKLFRILCLCKKLV
ncbi:hypothetical protein CRYUN_Cryun24cG0055400 [Craigia yunnanensis]